MLESGIPQSQILALTFTNKAAREMEQRIKELTGKKLQNLTISTFHALWSGNGSGKPIEYPQQLNQALVIPMGISKNSVSF